MPRTGRSRFCRISRWRTGSPPRSTWRGRCWARPSASSMRVSRSMPVRRWAAHGSARWRCTGCWASFIWRAATKRARSRSSSASCRSKAAVSSTRASAPPTRGTRSARSGCGRVERRTPARRLRTRSNVWRRTRWRASDSWPPVRSIRSRAPPVDRDTAQPGRRAPSVDAAVVQAAQLVIAGAHTEAARVVDEALALAAPGTRAGCFQSSRCCTSPRTRISGRGALAHLRNRAA